MPTYHTVLQGEHLSRIARRYGFPDYQVIWNHPENAALRQKRQNPNVLFPGDRLFIRDTELREEARSTEQRHVFTARRPTLTLRLVIEDQYARPLANTTCTLRIDSASREVTTDAKGRLTQAIPVDAEKATLIVQDAESPLDAIEIPIAIGELDPVSEPSGQRARLVNLGYLAGASDADAETDADPVANPVADVDDEFRSAVEEFQCEHGLTVDGTCGPATQARLQKVHGC